MHLMRALTTFDVFRAAQAGYTIPPVSHLLVTAYAIYMQTLWLNVVRQIIASIEAAEPCVYQVFIGRQVNEAVIHSNKMNKATGDEKLHCS